MSEPSTALVALERALQRTGPRARGNFNAQDFLAALRAAIEDAERNEWEDRMGDDL